MALKRTPAPVPVEDDTDQPVIATASVGGSPRVSHAVALPPPPPPGMMARPPVPPPGLSRMGGGAPPQAPQINPTAAIVGLALGGAPGALAATQGFQQGQQARIAQEDRQRIAKAKADAEQWKNDRQTWSDDLQALKFTHMLDEDEARAEGKEADRAGKEKDAAAREEREGAAQKARSLTETRLSRAGIVRDLLQLHPEAQNSFLDLIGPEELERVGLKVPRITRTSGEDGSPDIEEWDTSAFHPKAPASQTPEAIAARTEIERVQASNRAGLASLATLSKMAADPRTKPKSKAELYKRLGVASEALHKGEPIPSWVFDVSPDFQEAMTPAQKAGVDSKGRTGDQKDRALTEAERRNKASEADRDADRSQRANKPSAAMSEAQTRHGDLTNQASSYRADARKLRAKEAEANKKLEEISSLPQYRGVGGGARAQKHPGFAEAQSQAQSYGIEAINLENLAKESERERSKIESRYPALKASFKAGAQAGADDTPPSKKLPPLLFPSMKPGESKTLDGGFKIRRVK